MDGLTINEAARTTGWSSRMLRYLETVGLIEPPRSGAGYRIYGPGELQRLRTLRELLDRHGLGPSDLAIAKRLREDPELADEVARWLEAQPEQPEGVGDWLRWEQEKHEKLLSAA
jgi:DNA-binding transcriptional MerR regulator